MRLLRVVKMSFGGKPSLLRMGKVYLIMMGGSRTTAMVFLLVGAALSSMVGTKPISPSQ